MASTWGLSWGTSWGTSWDREFVPPEPPIPPEPRPAPANNAAGSVVGSAFRKGPRKSRPIYLGYRGLKPDEVTAEQLRETAQEVRDDEVLLTQEINALKAAVNRFENIDRLASAAQELRRAVEDAQRQQDEDDEAAVMLLTLH
jgi:hypothetical protein